MASTVIHMAVANEINKELKRNNDLLLIGSIAPDISKIVGENKVISHFQDSNNDLPNIDKFINKYKDYMNDDFVMGYFIHLYTDYLFYKYFMTEIFNEDLSMIRKLDGSEVKCSPNQFRLYVYNDYTNLNIELIDKYNLALGIFYNELPKINYIIEEIPMNRLQLIIDETSVIIENSKKSKEYIFNVDTIDRFISTSTEIILGYIKENNLN